MSDSVHTIYWKNHIEIAPNYSLCGYSRAKEATGFYCKELEMAFDAGITTNDVPAYICITHLHNDHIASLNKLLIDNPKNPKIFIPNNDKFEILLHSMLRFIYLSSKFIHPDSDKGKNPLSKYSYEIIKLDVHQSYKFKETNGCQYFIEGLPSNHGVASISFGIYEYRKRCKTEYKNLDKDVYKKLKKDGIVFTEYYKYPIFCYMSDTNIKPFLTETDLILQYPTIVVECTFLEPEDLHHAKKKNHIHWEQLYPIISGKTNLFILTHFSKKYTWNEIGKFFNYFFKNNNINTNIIVWSHTGLLNFNNTNILH